MIRHYCLIIGEGLFKISGENIENENLKCSIKKITKIDFLQKHCNIFVPAALELTIQKNEAEVDETNLIKVKSGKWNCIKCLRYSIF